MKTPKVQGPIPTRVINVKLPEDMIAMVDFKRHEYDFDRSSFVRYLIRKGLASIGVTPEETVGMAERQRALRDRARAEYAEYPDEQ